jgi:hypothetical protein
MPTGNPLAPRIWRGTAAAASTPPAKGKKRRREIFILLRMRMISFINGRILSSYSSVPKVLGFRTASSLPRLQMS